MSGFELLLLVIAGLIPALGFIMTLSHARKGESRREQRWRKSHGLIFWTLIPSIAGIVTVLGSIDLLPSLGGIIGIIILAGSTFLSWWIQRRHEEKSPES